MIKLTGFLVALLLVMSAASSWAADETPDGKLDARTKVMMEGLDQNQLRQFAAIRESHGTIKAVENVQASIKKAVEACSAKNPEIKDEINSRFDNWRLGIRPTIVKAKSKLDKMVLLQGFAKPSAVRSYLKLFDDAVAARDAKIKAVPVTEKAECEKLIRSMDKSEDTLVELLTKNLALDQPLQQKEL